jgi:hypothetical protein
MNARLSSQAALQPWIGFALIFIGTGRRGEINEMASGLVTVQPRCNSEWFWL